MTHWKGTKIESLSQKRQFTVLKRGIEKIYISSK
jgi:hypothetical protein